MLATVPLPRGDANGLAGGVEGRVGQSEAAVDGPPNPAALIARNDTPHQAWGHVLLTLWLPIATLAALTASGTPWAALG